MHIRPFTAADLERLVDLTIETFRPFYEGYVHPLFGDELFRLHHGQWEQDYRDEVPTLHDPSAGRWVAVAEVGDTIAGYVGWKTGGARNHGQIYMLVVGQPYRHQGVGRELCLDAIREMKAGGVEKVGVFTGGDPFHAAARALYQSLGFIEIPIAGYLKMV